MDFLEKAKTHFRAQIDGGFKKISVPEWGEKGQPLLIYYGPMTLVQRDKIYKYIVTDSLEMYVETLIQRSKTEHGVHMFKPINRTELMTMVDPNVVMRIANEMTKNNNFELEAELEKNS